MKDESENPSSQQHSVYDKFENNHVIDEPLLKIEFDREKDPLKKKERNANQVLPKVNSKKKEKDPLDELLINAHTGKPVIFANQDVLKVNSKNEKGLSDELLINARTGKPVILANHDLPKVDSKKKEKDPLDEPLINARTGKPVIFPNQELQSVDHPDYDTITILSELYDEYPITAAIDTGSTVDLIDPILVQKLGLSIISSTYTFKDLSGTPLKGEKCVASIRFRGIPLKVEFFLYKNLSSCNEETNYTDLSYN